MCCVDLGPSRYRHTNIPTPMPLQFARVLLHENHHPYGLHQVGSCCTHCTCACLCWCCWVSLTLHFSTLHFFSTLDFVCWGHITWTYYVTACCSPLWTVWMPLLAVTMLLPSTCSHRCGYEPAMSHGNALPRPWGSTKSESCEHSTAPT